MRRQNHSIVLSSWGRGGLPLTQPVEEASTRLFSTWLALVPALLASCASPPIDGRLPDAPPPVDAAPVADYSWDEGGESRLQYFDIYDPNNPAVSRKLATATAVFYKSKTPKSYPHPPNPGCSKMELDNWWPLGHAPVREYQDVGQVIYTGGDMQINLLPGNTPPPNNIDVMGRAHFGPWRNFSSPTAGATFLGNTNKLYDVIFTGSETWPAQAYPDAHFMPAAWTLNTINGVAAFQPLILQADTPLVITYTPGANTNKPPNTKLTQVTALFVPGIGPVVACIELTLDGSITIPADMVNHARSAPLASGVAWSTLTGFASTRTASPITTSGSISSHNGATVCRGPRLPELLTSTH